MDALIPPSHAARNPARPSRKPAFSTYIFANVPGPASSAETSEVRFPCSMRASADSRAYATIFR